MKKNNRKIYIENFRLKKTDIFFNLYKEYFLELNIKKKIEKNLIIKILKKLFSNKDKKKFLINVESNVVGFLIVNYAKNILNQNVCYINDFYILKDFRKKGYAETSIKKFIDESKKKNIKELRLEILDQNYLAKNFWNKFKLYKKSINYIIKVK